MPAGEFVEDQTAGDECKSLAADRRAENECVIAEAHDAGRLEIRKLMRGAEIAPPQRRLQMIEQGKAADVGCLQKPPFRAMK